MSATSIEIGPPSAPLRTPSAKATATMSPMIAGPLVSRSCGVDLVTDQAVDRIGHPDHHGETDQCEQVDAVGDVVPVGARRAAAADVSVAARAMWPSLRSAQAQRRTTDVIAERTYCRRCILV